MGRLIVSMNLSLDDFIEAQGQDDGSWRRTGLCHKKAKLALCRVGPPIRAKPRVEQIPQIVPCVAFLPIVLRNAVICRRNFSLAAIQYPW